MGGTGSDTGSIRISGVTIVVADDDGDNNNNWVYKFPFVYS